MLIAHRGIVITTPSAAPYFPLWCTMNHKVANTGRAEEVTLMDTKIEPLDLVLLFYLFIYFLNKRNKMLRLEIKSTE